MSVREGDRMHINPSRSGVSFLLETQEEDDDEKEERLWFGAKKQHLPDSSRTSPSLPSCYCS